MAVNNVSNSFDMEMYTTKLDPSKISEDKKREAERIAAEIENERLRKERSRSGASKSLRHLSGEYEDDGPGPIYSRNGTFPILDVSTAADLSTCCFFRVPNAAQI
jgi:hypothetical protein